MTTSDGDSAWVPQVEDIVAIHEDVISEYPGAETGGRNRRAIEFAVGHVHRVGAEEAEPLHEKAFQLLRLLTANHPFVDGHKRTALDVTATFYFFNGYAFDYDHEIRTILNSFATDERAVDRERVLRYFESNTEPIDLDVEISEWREDLVQQGLDRLETHDDESSDRRG